MLFSVSLMEKADARQEELSFRFTPTTDPQRMKVGGNLRPGTDPRTHNDGVPCSNQGVATIFGLLHRVLLSSAVSNYCSSGDKFAGNFVTAI